MRLTIDAISSVGVVEGVRVCVLDGLGVFVENLLVEVRVGVETAVAVSVIVGDSGEVKFCAGELQAEKINRVRNTKPHFFVIDAGYYE